MTHFHILPAIHIICYSTACLIHQPLTVYGQFNVIVLVAYIILVYDIVCFSVSGTYSEYVSGTIRLAALFMLIKCLYPILSEVMFLPLDPQPSVKVAFMLL